VNCTYRYYDVLKYALKSREAAFKKNYDDQKKYYSLMAKEDSYVSLLRIFECFLEAVPQEILQICIVLVEKKQGSTFQSNVTYVIYIFEYCS
jgi:hypothetical protein